MRVLALSPGPLSLQLERLPVLASLCSSVGANLQVACSPAVKAAWELLPQLEKVIPFNFEASPTLADWANLLGCVREPDFQVCLNFAEGQQVNLMLSMSHIPSRIAGSGFSSTELVTPHPGWSSQRLGSYLKPLGCELDADAFRLALPTTALEKARADLPAGDGPLLVLAPKGGSADWPVDAWTALPETISHIVNLSDEQLTVSRLVKLIEPDPVFLAHIIGKASKALYGSVPQSLEQAIGRNLGVNNVRNLAVLFAAQQYLTVQSVHPNIERLIDAMLLSNALFESLFASEYSSDDKALIAQLTLFGPLALLLIFHTEHLDASLFFEQWQNASSFNEFQSALAAEHNLCLYGASSLLLVRWGFTSKVNQTLWRLCQEPDAKVNKRIRCCHELAFNSLCFNQAQIHDEQLAAVLSEQQLTEAMELLAKW